MMTNKNKWESPYTPPYYDFREIEKRAPRIACCIGGRGVGKTNYYKRKAIYNYLNTGKRTIFVKRFKEERNQFRNKFLQDIHKGDKRLGKLQLTIKGNYLLIGDPKENNIVIEFVALSQSITLTGISYENYNMLVFDEFLTLGQPIRGMKEEVLFFHFLETCFRDREDIFIALLSNAVSSTSAYFDMLGFKKPLNPNRTYQSPNKDTRIVVEIYRDDTFQEHKEESMLYSLLNHDEYARFSLENEFIGEDTSNIIDKRDFKGHLELYAKILTDEGILDVLMFKNAIPLIVKGDYSPDVNMYTFHKELVSEGAIYIDSAHQLSMYLTRKLMNKSIRYENMKVKKQFMGNIKKIVRTYY